MLFADKLSFDHPRKTQDGYMVVRARAARAGIYDYLGKEVDPEGNTFAADQTVRVYRSEAEVFAVDSVASFLMKPVTNDHPSQPVTAENWRDYAKGVVGKSLRDGEYLAFDIVLMDKATIADVEAGKRELSNGYSSLIDFTGGQTEDGQPYDAVQKQIRGNHVAVVDKGRAGPMCRIGDAVSVAAIPASELIEILTDGQTYSDQNSDITNEPARRETSNSGGSHVATKTITFDGLPLEVTDAAEAAITKLQGQITKLTEDKAKADGDVAKLTTDAATKDAEIVTLKKQVDDAKVTPAQLRDAAKVYAKTVETAKKLAPTLTIADDADEASIKKAVVSAKLGDAAKDWSDEQVAVSFDTLASQSTDGNSIDPVRNALSGGVQTVGDAKAEYEKARDKARSNLSERYKGAPAKADA
jgi:hypothetical protein